MNRALPPTIVQEGYAQCERIAARDKPHLYDAAQLFAFPETRRAFASTYASMRRIDDFVDDIPDRAALTDHSRGTAASHIADWTGCVESAREGRPSPEPAWQALADTFARFDLPLEPWHCMARAMKSDLSTPFFRDWEHLRGYMDGASVAPAVVFMYLVLMNREGPGGRFISPWPYAEVHAATQDLAIFCYWVHILRDVTIDLSLGNEGLVYLPLADLKEFGLGVGDLKRMRDERRADQAYINLARSLAARAERHLEHGRIHMARIVAVAPPGNLPALQTLVETYVHVLQDLADRNFDVFAEPAVPASAPAERLPTG